VIAELDLIGMLQHMAFHDPAVDAKPVDAFQVFDNRNGIDGGDLAVMAADETGIEPKFVIRSSTDAHPAWPQWPS